MSISRSAPPKTPVPTVVLAGGLEVKNCTYALFIPAKSDRLARKTWLWTAASKLLPSELKVSLNPLKICNNRLQAKVTRLLTVSVTCPCIVWATIERSYQNKLHTRNTETNPSFCTAALACIYCTGRPVTTYIPMLGTQIGGVGTTIAGLQLPQMSALR